MDAVPTRIPWTQCRAILDPHAVRQARVVLCDLDGCLMSEGHLFDDTSDFVAACGDRLRIVSNRSDCTAQALSQQLGALGLQVPPANILLAGEFTLRHLADRGLRRLTLCADPTLFDAARQLGIDPRSPAPEAVLLCRDPRQNVDTLGPLARKLAAGVPLWVSNEDLSHPDLNGHPVAETGALLAALRAILPSLTWQCVGKPNPAMLLHAMAEADVAPSEAIFVGDNAQTDGRAAMHAGLPLLHIQRSSVE